MRTCTLLNIYYANTFSHLYKQFITYLNNELEEQNSFDPDKIFQFYLKFLCEEGSNLDASEESQIIYWKIQNIQKQCLQ